MIKKFSLAMNARGGIIDSKISNGFFLICLFAIPMAMLCFSIRWIGVSGFSPDSWSYYDLSKTVFSGDFYGSNTVRSFFSEHYSTSFPFGYPLALSVLHLFTGTTPEIASYFNAFAAAISAYLLIKICSHLQLPSIYGVAIALSLLLHPYYIGEVISGLSIPFAILLFSFAGLQYLEGRFFLAGVFLGLSAIVRFDFLSHSAIFIVAVTASRWPGFRDISKLTLGLLIGISPWSWYSYSHFGIFWASDNSWVAMSALPAYVDDYPALATVSVSQDFFRWLNRIFSNIAPLAKTLSISFITFPLLPIISTAALIKLDYLYKFINFKSITIFLLIALALFPYTLTGYFANRYYIVHLVCLSLLLASYVTKLTDQYLFSLSLQGLAFVSVLLTISAGVVSLSTYSIIYIRQRDAVYEKFSLIEHLRQCHIRNPKVTYIFNSSTSDLSHFMYGSITGMRTSRLPSNFSVMSESEKTAFFSHLSPYVVIEMFSRGSKCPI